VFKRDEIKNQVKGVVSELQLDGKREYKGEILHDEPHGLGKMIYGNGEEFIGQFVKGQRSGEGKSVKKNGDQYEGEFLDGKRHGTGTAESED
jgi:hypothetical protein